MVNARCQFHTVQDINRWVQEQRNKSEHGKKLEIINEHNINRLLRTSKLDRNQLPRIKRLTSLFAGTSESVNPDLINTIVESLVTDSSENNKIFSEEIFLYMLQHHTTSPEGLIGIIESIIFFLHRDIDEFKVAELLVLQCLVSIQKKDIKLTPALVSTIDRLTEAINQRFHSTNCILQFEPCVIHVFLEHYIKCGKLAGCKILFADLINKGFCPNAELVTGYLNLIEEKIGSGVNNEELLRKFAYISDFSPVFHTVFSPQIMEYLISYCRHFNEVLSLLLLAEQSVMMKQIYDTNLPQLIRKVSLLTRNSLKNSANLCSLYDRAENYYGQNLSDKVKSVFILQFAVNHNFSMVAKLLTSLKETPSPNYFARIMAMVEQWPYGEFSSSSPGFSKTFKKAFMEEFVLPSFSRMSDAGKLTVLSHLESIELMLPAVKVEMDVLKNGKGSVLPQILVRAYINGFEPLTSSIIKTLSLSSSGLSILEQASEMHTPISNLLQAAVDKAKSS